MDGFLSPGWSITLDAGMGRAYSGANIDTISGDKFMDFANDDINGFAAFYDRLRRAMTAQGSEYKRALERTYNNSTEYRNAILRAYEKEGFTLHADLGEPDERIKCEFWNFFSPQKYDMNMHHLLLAMPIIVRTLDERFWYNSNCVDAAENILDALVKSGSAHDGSRTIGDILDAPPFPLKEPPEFCPRITPEQAGRGIGPRRVGSGKNLQNPEVA